MKRILVCVFLLLISGCYSDNFKELGYDDAEVKMLRTLSKDNQVFFSEKYDEFLAQLVANENFSEDKLQDYLLYQDLLDGYSTVDLVNEGIITKSNYGTLKSLVKVSSFDVSKVKDYLKYPKTNPEAVVAMVNAGLEKEYEFIKELSKDSMFVADNLALYLEYKDEKEDIRTLVEYINAKIYLPYYSEKLEADTQKYGYHVLVNKYYSLSEDYEPSDLVEVESSYGVGRLRSEAYEAYKQMQDDAKEAGYSFYITSPYRSYETQDRLYNRYLASDTQENVDIYSARPGSSEHQLGLAVDILKSGYDFGNFYQTPEALWLKENAYKYGFILRYPEDKIEVTGYKYEPWHYRYVGDIAEDVYNSGVSFDEYFEKYIKEK